MIPLPHHYKALHDLKLTTHTTLQTVMINDSVLPSNVKYSSDTDVLIARIVNKCLKKVFMEATWGCNPLKGAGNKGYELT